MDNKDLDNKNKNIDADPSEEIANLLKDFGTIKSTLLKNLQDDRSDIDKYIKRFSRRIAKKEEVKQYYVEALTTLLATKANTSLNSVKVLDSIAKIMAASKNHNALDIADADDTDLSELLRDDTESDAGFDPDNP